MHLEYECEISNTQQTGKVNFAISALVSVQTRDRLVLEIIVIETKDQGHPLNDLFSIQNIE